LNQSTSRTLHRRQEGQPGPGCSDPPQGPRTRARERPGVHTADISSLTVDMSDGNPWNSAIPSRSTTSGRCWCPLRGHRPPARPPSSSPSPSGRPDPPWVPAGASASDVMTLKCLRS